MTVSKLSRRSALLGLTAAVSMGRVSLALADAPTDRRFVVVLLRGALDGLAAVVPYGDPALADLRGEISPPSPGKPDGTLDLGGFYGLHPELAGLHAMYAAGELLAIHAVAGSWRSRSHFDAQDCLESGADHRMTSGWLNRAVLALPPRAPSRGAEALAVGVVVPLLLRGPAPAGNWAPENFAAPEPDLYATIAALHRTDPATGPAIAEGLRQRGFAAGALAGMDHAQSGFSALAAAAGRMLAAPDGPRVAALELGGWDTHADQEQRLRRPLGQLDAGLVALKGALGAAWAETAVLVVTEFGRTARVNGTRGTDHGTGTVAFVLGGNVKGGRVLAHWPGLGAGMLLDGRDLQPTIDLRSVAKGLLANHLGLPRSAQLAAFPGSERAEPAGGLLQLRA